MEPSPSSGPLERAPLTVDVWSDVGCPWCFIGSRNLRAAIAASGLDVAITWHAFQLRPELPPAGGPYPGVFADSYGADAFAEAEQRVTEVGASAGIEFRFDRVRVAPNTRRAHRLVVAAQARRAAALDAPGATGDPLADVDGLVDALFTAYFLDGANIGDDAELARLGVAHGVGRTSAEVLAAIDDPGTDYVVDDDLATAASLGITGVPVFVCGGVGVVGAQPPAALRRLLARGATGS